MTNIIVRAKSQKGRYRAGMHFTRDATVLAVADLTREQLQALRDDPELTVTLPAETDAQRAKREAALKAAEEQAAADAKAKAAEEQAAADAKAKAAEEQAAADAKAKAAEEQAAADAKAKAAADAAKASGTKKAGK